MRHYRCKQLHLRDQINFCPEEKNNMFKGLRVKEYNSHGTYISWNSDIDAHTSGAIYVICSI